MKFGWKTIFYIWQNKSGEIYWQDSKLYMCHLDCFTPSSRSQDLQTMFICFFFLLHGKRQQITLNLSLATWLESIKRKNSIFLSGAFQTIKPSLFLWPSFARKCSHLFFFRKMYVIVAFMVSSKFLWSSIIALTSDTICPLW